MQKKGNKNNKQECEESVKVNSSKWLANKLSHLLVLKKKVKSQGIIKMRRKITTTKAKVSKQSEELKIYIVFEICVSQKPSLRAVCG